jgi:uncharacterized protein YbaA (DUF1428 family)
MSYLQLYIYRILREHHDEFLEVMQNARAIYRKHGADGEELFLIREKDAMYSLASLDDVLPIEEGEEIWIGLDRYKDEQHCKKVMKKVDADPEIEPLYEKVVKMVGKASRIVRGQFTQVEY